MFTAATAASSLVFVTTLAVSLLGLYVQPRLITNSLFRPYWFVRNREYATVITSALVHADVGHLLFNMVTFYFFAFSLESLYIGTASFVILYSVALVTSHACTYYLKRDRQEYASLGASGAISAVLFAYIVYSPGSMLLIFPIPLPIPAVVFALAYVAYSYYAGRKESGRVNHDAHLCGALTGLVYVGITEPTAYRSMYRLVFG